MKNLLPLPDHLCEKVYLYDPTYRAIFDVCLTQMLFEFAQREELNDLLVEQEIDRNVFEFNGSIYIHDQLHGTHNDDEFYLDLVRFNLWNQQNKQGNTSIKQNGIWRMYNGNLSTVPKAYAKAHIHIPTL